ncbi:MAG: MlaD family protein, partial [Brevundimonas sp.]|nr:MlaD family protein [Brevundimonas sp.]
FNSDYYVYDIVFYGPVRGLSEGGEVHFNGIRVGEVTDLNLDPNKGDQVIARIRIDGTTPVRVTSRAQLEPQGITGLNYIQITAGNPNSAILKEQYPDNVVPVIQSQPSPIAELLSGSGTVLAQTVDALNRINRVLSDDNVRSFSTSLKNIESLSTELEARKGMLQQLEQALTRANSAVAEYEALAVSTRGIIEGDGKEAVANINAAAEEARTAVAAINRIATGAEGPVNEFVTTGLPQLQQSIQGLEDATRSLEGLVDEVRASPRDFIGRAPSKEMEVQP